MTKGVSRVTPVTVRTGGAGLGAERWKTEKREKRAAIIVTAMATMARLKPRVGAILPLKFPGCNLQLSDGQFCALV